jgi:predicted flap endonuclease-1-like 5' DNA nuclease
MKRLLRFFTAIGAAGAIAWLLRDRLVSVTTSREPEQPELLPEPPRPQSGDDLTAVKGIGPTYAARLEANGITTIGMLSGANASELSETIGVPVARVTAWIEEAKAST